MADVVRIKMEADAAKPHRAYIGDAAYDLSAFDSVRLLPHKRALVRTGVSIEMPPGIAGLVLPRSGLALDFGVTVLNAPGLIDPGYRGEIGVILHNTNTFGFQVEIGMKIAQLMFIEPTAVRLDTVDSLTESERGDRGFGSSGR